MKKILTLITVNLIVLLLISAPVLVSADDGLIPCGHSVTTIVDGKPVTTVPNPCNICHLFKGVDGLVDFIIYSFAMPLAVAVLIYGGIMWVTAGASEGNIRAGQNAIRRAVVGMVIVFAAWIIVDTVLKILAGNVSGQPFKIQDWGLWNAIPGTC